MSFSAASVWLARQLGRPSAFLITAAVILACIAAALVPAWRDPVLLWSGAATGWLSLICLSVLQNSTNREAAANAARLDEIVKAIPGARDELIRLEERTAEEIAALRQEGIK